MMQPSVLQLQAGAFDLALWNGWRNFLLVTYQVALVEKLSKQEKQENEIEYLNIEEVAEVAAGKHRHSAVGNNYDKLDQLNNGNERFDVLDHSVDFFALVRADEVVSGKQSHLKSPLT